MFPAFSCKIFLLCSNASADCSDYLRTGCYSVYQSYVWTSWGITFIGKCISWLKTVQCLSAVIVVWRLCWYRCQRLPASLSVLSWGLILYSLFATWSNEAWILNLRNYYLQEISSNLLRYAQISFSAVLKSCNGRAFGVPDQWLAPWDNGALRCASMVREELWGSVHGRTPGLGPALPLPWSIGYAGLEEWQHGWKWRETIIRYCISLVVFEFRVSLCFVLFCVWEERFIFLVLFLHDPCGLGGIPLMFSV